MVKNFPIRTPPAITFFSIGDQPNQCVTSQVSVTKLRTLLAILMRRDR
jgi:hypothetical protein